MRHVTMKALLAHFWRVTWLVNYIPISTRLQASEEESVGCSIASAKRVINADQSHMLPSRGFMAMHDIARILVLRQRPSLLLAGTRLKDDAVNRFRSKGL